MPVYNEEATIAEVLDNVLGVELPDGVALELVIVESNSTDDTRKLVTKYANSDPRVTLILQDRARGKGHAVRQGLGRVTGEVVMIQDGDLEYRVDDYPKLLRPILDGEADFVLGSRHVPGQQMREFTDARLTSWVMNMAHWFFTWLFNVAFGAHLRDPFTMYKVFRRECIEGLSFVSDRFDFDWELAGKLVRRGYVPLEVPVSYHSRGYEGGKKVRLVRDPLTWFLAVYRVRTSRIPRPNAADVRTSTEQAPAGS